MRWKIAGVVFAACAVLLAMMLWPEPSSTRTLPDDSTLVVSGLRIGKTNIYVHGTFLSKTIGRLSPQKGFSVLGVQVNPPAISKYGRLWDADVLTTEVRLLPGSPREQNFLRPPFYRKIRLSILADDEFAAVQDFLGFKKQPDGIFAPIWAYNFPRDAKVLKFRFEERDSSKSRDWKELATFEMKNPKPARVQPWAYTNNPKFKLPNGLDVEIGELVVRREPINPTDIWEYLALLPVRVSSNGQSLTNWGIHNGPVADASGNTDSFTFSKVVTNDWMVYRMFRPLDPTKIWKFKVNMALDSDFPTTNLYSINVPLPLAQPIQTNLGGFPVHIEFVNQDMLSVHLLKEEEGTRLTFVGAVDPSGKNIDRLSGSWTQHLFWRSLQLNGPTTVQATVAIHTNYPVEFTLKPMFEKAAANPAAK